jgi:glutamate-1-semialdehyde 2,1-aminomutase
MLARWPHFRGVTLALSLDGVGAVNDYIRHPARWEVIERNLRMIDEEHARFNVTAAWVNTTVQLYNVFHLAELVEHLHGNYRFINPMPWLAPLFSPDYFDVRILPRGLKREAARRLLALADRLGEASVDDRAQIVGLVTHMESRRPSPLRCAEFRRVTRAFDRLRGEDVLGVAPELAPLMKPGLTTRAAMVVERGRNRLAGFPGARRAWRVLRRS